MPWKMVAVPIDPRFEAPRYERRWFYDPPTLEELNQQEIQRWKNSPEGLKFAQEESLRRQVEFISLCNFINTERAKVIKTFKRLAGEFCENVIDKGDLNPGLEERQAFINSVLTFMVEGSNVGRFAKPIFDNALNGTPIEPLGVLLGFGVRENPRATWEFWLKKNPSKNLPAFYDPNYFPPPEIPLPGDEPLPLRLRGASPFALREANRTPVERIRLKHQQEKGMGIKEAIKEQNDFNYSAISDPPLAKADFRRGYFEQWSRFHKFIVQSIAARLFDPIDDAAKLELRKIYTDQYSRWKKLDPVAAINFHKLDWRRELLITGNQPLDLPDGKTIATILNKHIFDPLRQAGIDPSTTVPIEAQAQLRFFNETGLTRQPGMLRIIGR